MSINGKAIHILGAKQNNLKNLDIEIPLNQLTVVTGVSGSGKSTFAFDILYAEGQRRYVESFSAYARQFLDRMDKPDVESIEGIPPTIAIDQSRPVRTSRSTVGTMTELHDHFKLLFAKIAVLYCRGCQSAWSSATGAVSVLNKLDGNGRRHGDGFSVSLASVISELGRSAQRSAPGRFSSAFSPIKAICELDDSHKRAGKKGDLASRRRSFRFSAAEQKTHRRLIGAGVSLWQRPVEFILTEQEWRQRAVQQSSALPALRYFLPRSGAEYFFL